MKPVDALRSLRQGLYCQEFTDSENSMASENSIVTNKSLEVEFSGQIEVCHRLN